MGNSADPPLVLAPPPTPDAGKLLYFVPVPYPLGPHRKDKDFRSFVAAMIRAYNGFGRGEITSGEKPPVGRPEAYGYLLFPFAGDNAHAADYASSKCDGHHSSCAVTVRSLWMVLGARHPLLNPPYASSRVFPYLRAFAILCNAYRGAEGGAIKTGRDHHRITPEEEKGIQPIPRLTWDTFDPQPGDVLMMLDEKSQQQHMSTIVELDGKKNDKFVEFVACDGGQKTPGDEPCCGISLIRRKVRRTNKKTDWGESLEDSSTKEVFGWVDVSKLEFVANFYTICRNAGRLDLPNPIPIGS